MATRTVKLMGYTTDSGVNTVFNFNGTEVFNGVISSGGDSDNLIPLLSFDIDQTLSGNIPSTITVSGGGVTVVLLTANYSQTESVEFTGKDGVVMEAVTASDVLNNFAPIDGSASNQSKLNISIDGEAYDKGDLTGLPGAWHISLIDGQSMTCDWSVLATPTG